MFVKHRFYLSEYTKDMLHDMEPQFGYEGFGEFVFYRTYSRVNKEGKQETWADVVIRVIEGTMSIRKDWYLKTRVSWNEKYWQELARNMAVSMFHMEWLPPGRGLWAMGTDFIYERGGMSLANCGYTDITDNFEDDFAWLMNVMMVGVGVGFTPFRNDSIIFKNTRNSYEHVIEDSKEGWINSLIALFQAYKYGASKPKFVYDEIRPAGLPIKGFGGISSGPDPLIYLHQQIEENIELYMTDTYYDSVIFKTDCANQIGTCIVSGNVRRCIPRGMWVSTTVGMKKIEELRKNDQVQTLNGYKPILNVFKQGRQKLISVILENGKEFRCTPNHKFAVLTSIWGEYNWVEAQDLNEDDVLLISHIPTKGINLSVDEAYFWGVLNGDGHVRYNPKHGTQTTITFSSDEIGYKSTDKIQEYLKSICINSTEKYPVESKNYHKLRIYGTDFAKECLPYKTPNKAPVIPEKIYTASPEARAAYIAGLCDADGSPSRYNLCSSKWKSFLEQVRIITSSLGIDTYIHTRPERVSNQTGKIYERENCLIIRGFASRQLACKLINPYMCKQLVKKNNTKDDCNIPISFAYSALQNDDLEKSTFDLLTRESRTSSPKRNPIHKQLIDLYPELWRKVIPCKVSFIEDFEEEEETYDIEVEDDHCFFAEGVLVHNSAELSCLSIKDPIFKDLKNYNKYPRRSEWGWMSNNSVDLEDDEDFDLLPEIAKTIANNGEPGIKNLRNFPKGRLGKKDKVKKDRATGVNACITSDTPILTADGKGFVKFKDLLDEDINVFCINDKDEICIRKMRNPRLTGYSQKILKIVFDNEDSIRVSETHKFMLRDRSFVEAKNLKIGDRLAVVRRYIPENCQGKSYWDKYISLSYSGGTIAEHKLIAEDKFGYIFDSEHVHHTNEDKLDNDPNNLEVKECFNHLSEHSIGEENGNWSGYSNEQIIKFGLELAKKLGRRFSVNEWKELGLIQLTSEYRKNKLGSFEEFAYYCADIAEVKNEPVDTRTLRYYLSMIDKGYDTEIRDKQVFVKKICEGCKNEFWIEAQRREQASCSLSCNNTIRDYSKNTETNRKIWAQKKKNLQEKQLEVYCQLKNNLDRSPTKSEWMQGCRDVEISFEISRDSSPFRSWEDLKYNAKLHNHKVLAVIEDGYEDVYNGTVDEFHNFIIGGWESFTPFGRRVSVGVVTPQCGEQLLEHRETCIIDETFPTICNDPERWLQACEYATLYCSTVSLLPTDQPSTNEVVARNRRIGVGIVDFTGWVADIGMSNVIKYLRKGYKRVRKTNRHYNGEAGVPEAIRVTTIKPGGTVPKLAGKTSGAMYPNFHYMIRRARVARNSPIHEILVRANIPYEPDLVSQNTDVFEFPLPTNPNVPQAEDVSIWQQAMNLIILQREWSDNSVSNTLNFRPKWVLIKHWEEDIENQLRNWYDPHQRNHYETNAFIQSIYLCEEYIAGGFKLNIKWDLEQDIIEECRIYEFDPRHEEDALEAVLASIAPVIKTASVLPATNHGVYEQMPESGITEEEYIRRKSLIKPINWSMLSGSMGEDEKFCSGESCEILTK